MQVDEKRWWAYDGAEVCELVGSFHQIKLVQNVINIVSVYIIITGCQYLKTQLERIEKSLQKAFKVFGLEIAVESDLENCKLSGRDTEP